MEVKVTLNGEMHTLTTGRTIVDLIEARRPRPPFAVEVNKRLVRRPDYGAVELRDGDQVEIVTLVGGG